MSYTKQQHVFSNLTVGTALITKMSVNAFVPFMVKKIRFDFAYTSTATVLGNYVVSSDIVNNEAVGTMNRFSYYTAGAPAKYTIVDGFSDDKMFDYVFRDPISANGGIVFTFNNLATTSVIDNCDVVVLKNGIVITLFRHNPMPGVNGVDIVYVDAAAPQLN